MAVDIQALMPILFAAIVANIAIVVVVLASGRLGQRREETAAEASSARLGRAVEAVGRRPIADEQAPSGSAASRPVGFSAPVQPMPSDDPVTDPASDDDAASGDANDETDGGDAPARDIDASPTRLIDPAGWERHVVAEDARVRRYHHPATVVVVALDGPDVSDRVESWVAATIRRLARDADHVARLEMGRFAVLLPETDEISAINYVERIRAATESWLAEESVAVRLAIGWAGTTGDPTLPDAQRLASDRMGAELRRGSEVTSIESARPS